MSDPLKANADEATAVSNFEDLLVEALGVLEDGGTAGFDAFVETRPEHAAALRARVAELVQLGLVERATLDTTPRAERMGDFRLIAEIGGGGMGIVYEAEQESLGRRVALKLIRPELMWFGGSRARFRREIEAVARLSHPGIVPIYTVGEERGVPFFAMEFVEGCTLAQVIDELAKQPVTKLTGADLLAVVDRLAPRPRDANETSTRLGVMPDASWNDTVVRLVRQVADALEHTHSRGVVHRDIKPSNIVITRSGRAMLIDFGLAAKEGGERITRSGSAGGSAAYMSPEQANGGDVDARSDIYSLGVTFAELLTLRQVFEGSSINLVWQAIVAGNFKKPRELVPSIPWDLETVCLTAMETDRARRYATAGDFARDLSNLLARRPIDARRAGPMLRVLRWAQRHPRISAALIAGAGLGLVASLVYARQQSVLGRKILEQRDVARARAEELRVLATSFVFDVHDKISRLPGATEAREQVVTQAQSLFDALARAEADDPTLAHDLAVANLRLGPILERTSGGTLGQTGGAREHLESAHSYFAEHASAADASVEERRYLVRAEYLLGSLLTKTGEAEAGMRMLESGVEHARVLAQLPAATIEDGAHVAWLQLELAQNCERRGDADRANALFEGCVQQLVALETEHPGDVTVLRLQPRAYLLFGNICDTRDQPERALELLAQGVAAADRLLVVEPLAPVNRRARANCLECLGGILVRSARSEEGLAQYELALGLYEELQREDPLDGQHFVDYTRALDGFANACATLDRHDEVIKTCERALALLDNAPDSAGATDLTVRRLSILQNLAGAEHALGRVDEAHAHMAAADELARKLSEANPRDVYTMSAWAQLLREWAEISVKPEQAAERVALHRRAMETYARWRELASNRGIAVSEGAFEHALFARALANAGAHAAACAEYRLACAELATSVTDATRDSMLLLRGAFGLIEASQTFADCDDDAESIRMCSLAWSWLERVADTDPDSATTLIYAQAVLEMMVESAVQRDELHEADEWTRRSLALRERLARRPEASPIEAVLVAKDLLEGARETTRDPARALELCRLAVERAADQPVPRYWLAKAFRATRDDARALETARAALALIADIADPAQAKLVAKLNALIAELEFAGR